MISTSSLRGGKKNDGETILLFVLFLLFCFLTCVLCVYAEDACAFQVKPSVCVFTGMYGSCSAFRQGPSLHSTLATWHPFRGSHRLQYKTGSTHYKRVQWRTPYVFFSLLIIVIIIVIIIVMIIVSILWVLLFCYYYCKCGDICLNYYGFVCNMNWLCGFHARGVRLTRRDGGEKSLCYCVCWSWLLSFFSKSTHNNDMNYFKMSHICLE